VKADFEISVHGHRVISLEARLPQPPLPPADPLEALKELVAEYGAASSRERNYGRARFADLFFHYLTDLMPVIEQRHAGRRAESEAMLARILAVARGLPPPRPGLHVVGKNQP